MCHLALPEPSDFREIAAQALSESLSRARRARISGGDMAPFGFWRQRDDPSALHRLPGALHRARVAPRRLGDQAVTARRIAC